MLQWDELTKTQKFGFRHARTAALCSPGIGRGSYRIGAVICNGRTVVSSGFNSYRTHPKLHKCQYPYLHAEQAVLFKYGSDNCFGLDVYVYRIWRDNSTLAMAKPCERCQQFIELAGIKRVYYTTYGSYDYYDA